MKALQYLETQDWGTASALGLSRGMSPRQPPASPFRAKVDSSPLHKLALQASFRSGDITEEEGYRRAKGLVAELAELRAELEAGATGDTTGGTVPR